MSNKIKLTLGAILIVGSLTSCTSVKVAETKVSLKEEVKVVVEKPVAVIVDGENFVNNTTVEEFFSGNQIGMTLELKLQTAIHGKGTKGIAYEYNVAEEGYTGTSIRFETPANWTGGKAIKMYMKRDASGNKAVFQFKESNGEYWETSLNLTKDETGELVIPFTEFKQPPWGGKVDGILDLSKISEFSMYINEVKGQTKFKQGTLIYDDIEVIK